MDDEAIHNSIEALVEREHELWQRESDGTATEDDRAQLQAVKVSLDRCWDVLRQRRALSRAGLDPDSARVRDADVVEGYEQ